MLRVLLLLLGFHCCASFAPLLHTFSTPNSRRTTFSKKLHVSNLLDEFKTAKGEMVNPYKVLKVSRDADVSTVKKAYRDLSRKFHPDGFRHRRLLPGSCNNLDEVRDQWERIRISYKILKSPKLRKRYDRHEVMTDPKAAMQRAAVDATLKGVQGMGQGLFQIGSEVGKGLFSAGAFAFQQLTKDKEIKSPKTEEENADDSNADAVTSFPSMNEVVSSVKQAVGNGTESGPGLAPIV